MTTIIRRYTFLFIIFFLLTIISAVAFAQETNKTPGIVHKPLRQEDLPFPGMPMPLSVTLTNTHNSQLSVRGFVSRDGKLLDVSLNDFSADDQDRLVYSTTINAPLAELSYQFVLMSDHEVVATSKHYTVRRTCLPRVDTIDTDIPPKTPLNVKVKMLQSQATGLQDELQNYETVLKLLEELRQLTEK